MKNQMPQKQRIATSTETIEEPRIKVTRIGNRWHARLLLDESVIDEMSCELKCDIGWICREMLRWYSKIGGVSLLAESARNRQTAAPTGKVRYRFRL